MTWGKANKKLSTWHVIMRDGFGLHTLCGVNLPVTYRPNRITPPPKKERCKLCNRSLTRAAINKNLKKFHIKKLCAKK